MRGICLEGKKEPTLITWAIKRQGPPSRVRIPFVQFDGSSAQPCVCLGTHVRIGEKIAAPKTANGISFHASISGEVTHVPDAPPTAPGGRAFVEITSDGQNEKWPGIGEERASWRELSRQALLEIFRSSGLVRMDQGMRPLHFNHSKTSDQADRILILNGCESEPYVTSDHALMMSHPIEILKGAEILRKVFCRESVVIVTQGNKLEVAELLKSKIYFLKWKHMEIKTFPSIYPQGTEETLMHEISGMPYAAMGPEDEWRLGVHSVATAFAVYEAVALQKPLVERAVTVGGECVVEPKNMWIPMGTSFESAIKTCRGLLRDPEKILMGGPMKGTAQGSLDAAVLPATPAILALPKEVAVSAASEPCIRCNQCVEACPVEISPAMITLAAEKDRWDMASEWGVDYCIECGNCSYVCPAKRPMAELIQCAKFHLGTGTDEKARKD